MLNISNTSVKKLMNHEQLNSLQLVESKSSGRVFIKILSALFFIALILLFIPWTQVIQAPGNLTALRPDQRPQSIQSMIAGRIEKWYVQEGDFVKRGDTILFISEIKEEYLDPELVQRTEDQLKAKELAVNSYMEKVRALDNQIDALVQTSSLKLEQANNKLRQAHLKVSSDSIYFSAMQNQYSTAELQFNRTKELHEKGLKSLTELENKRLTLQKAEASLIEAENKLLTSKNEIINAEVELTSIQAQYRDDIAKAESDKYTAMSSMYDAEATVTKLQNQFMNYSVRNGLYYIRAPQDGYITKAVQSGIGETVKEGTEIVSIMPADYQLAVEMYVRPIDLPLLQKKQHVRIQFDGWPAIVFSGWPNTSYGTYGGEVYAIDNFISANGKYRVLVAPDTSEYNWPEALRVGAGAHSMVLLKDVPVWYELWRQINGFPPDYYVAEASNTDKK